MEVRPYYAASNLVAGMKHVVVIIPVNADIDEAENVAEKTGNNGVSAAGEPSCGTFISKTMMVIMMARTPSLNASSLVFPR